MTPATVQPENQPTKPLVEPFAMRLLSAQLPRFVRWWICASLVLLAQATAWAHDQARPRQDNLQIADFPNVGDYQVLSVDLHTHSVFSDGHVWPSIRAEEAARDVLDGLAITEHLEWQPHLSDIPHEDRNRSYEETVRSAQNLDLLIIPGVEITRLGDPGHINAVFIKDANPLVKASGLKDYVPAHLFATKEGAEALAMAQSPAFAGAHQVERNNDTLWAPFDSRAIYMTLVNFGVAVERDPREVLDAAAAQGAFTFWNHPSFAAPNSKLNAFHASAIKGGVLHGVEIANGDHYYPNAHRLALKHGLALIGTSDVHQLIAWDYDRSKNQHRPVTLAFATERSGDAIKNALFAKRTVVWWNHTLIGRPRELNALLRASVSIESVTRGRDDKTRLQLRNHSGAPLTVLNKSKFGLTLDAGAFTLKPRALTTVDLRNAHKDGTLVLEVQNALLAPNKPARLSLPFEGP